MKKHLVVKQYLMLIWLVSMIFSGCTKTAKSYSCDPTIDSWVKSNSAAISKINRTQLGLMRGDSAVAVMHFLSAASKEAIWKEKIAIELANMSPLEQSYYSQLAKKYSRAIYQDEEARTKFEIYAKSWTEEVKKKLNWSDEHIFVLTNIVGTQKEISSAVHLNALPGANTCYCRYSLSCEGDKQCIDKDCGTDYKTDCGVFGTSSCTGTCW